MASLRTNAITRVATVAGVSLNTTTKQTLFEVPPGYTFIPTDVILRNASAAASTADADFGGNAAADDWLGTVQFDNLAGVGDAITVHPRGLKSGDLTANPTTEYAAGTEFGIKVGTTVAATVDVDVFGYLVSA